MTANAVSGEETGLVVKWPKVTQLITGRTRGGAQSLQVPRSGLLTTGDMPAPVRIARQADCQVCLHGLIRS